MLHTRCESYLIFVRRQANCVAELLGRNVLHRIRVGRRPFLRKLNPDCVRLPPGMPPPVPTLLLPRQTIAHLALPRGSLLRPQAVELLALFLAMPRPDPESAARQEPRGKTGRWVGRFGVGGGGGAGRSPRFGGHCCGEREDEGGVAASSSSFADAASFVLRYVDGAGVSFWREMIVCGDGGGERCCRLFFKRYSRKPRKPSPVDVHARI